MGVNYSLGCIDLFGQLDLRLLCLFLGVLNFYRFFLLSRIFFIYNLLSAEAFNWEKSVFEFIVVFE